MYRLYEEGETRGLFKGRRHHKSQSLSVFFFDPFDEGNLFIIMDIYNTEGLNCTWPVMVLLEEVHQISPSHSCTTPLTIAMSGGGPSSSKDLQEPPTRLGWRPLALGISHRPLPHPSRRTSDLKGHSNNPQQSWRRTSELEDTPPPPSSPGGGPLTSGNTHQ